MFEIFARVRKLRSGKYRVYSEAGRNFGTYDSRLKAEDRLREVEYFKHKDENSIDLKPDLSYSHIMREIKEDEDRRLAFMKSFKEAFDESFIKGIESPDKVALMTAIKSIDYRDDDE